MIKENGLGGKISKMLTLNLILIFPYLFVSLIIFHFWALLLGIVYIHNDITITNMTLNQPKR